MKYLFILLTFSFTSIQAQTFAEFQSVIEKERQEVLKNQLLRVEIYSFKNSKDSILISNKVFDSLGNIVNARQYSYKSRKYYREQFYTYDSLGRRIAFIRRDLHRDKIKRGKVTSIEKYHYQRDSLSERFIESYFNDSLLSIRELPERQHEKINYTRKEINSLGKIVHSEYYSVAGLERYEFKYDGNGQIQSSTCYVDDKLWYQIRYNQWGNVIEYIEWLYDAKSKKPIEHAITYYNADQLIIRVEYLNYKGKTKTVEKYNYLKRIYP